MINDVFEDIDEGEIDIDQCSMHQLGYPNFELEHMQALGFHGNDRFRYRVVTVWLK